MASLVRALLPSFVADWIWPDLRPSWKLHPTSYLDGLRGIASFIVFFCHYTEERHKWFVPSYGLNTDGPSAWIQLPYLRLIYSGRPMVHIFFVISGFALSYKPIKLLHMNNREGAYDALASSAFRRPIRLFLPCAVSTLGIAALAQQGVFRGAKKTASAQLCHWADVFFHAISWPWAWDQDLRPGYDVHLWTIPIEFAHSLLLFLVILVLSRLRTRLRQAANVLLIAYCVCSGKWAAFEFLAGLLLAERHVLQSRRQRLSRSGGGLRFFRCRRTIGLVFHAAGLLAALFVAGWPNMDADKTPGIRYLYAQTPRPFLANNQSAQKYWFGLAAVFIVWSVGEVEALRRLLEGGVAQYCGRISYAIYLVHGPGLDYYQDRVLGQAAVPARGDPSATTTAAAAAAYQPAVAGTGVKGIFGVATPAQRTATWLVGLLLLGTIMVWLSDLFWRLVDVPIVALGRKLEMACIESPSPKAEASRDDDSPA